MANFDDAVNYVLENEGSYSNNESDKGGETNFGLSFRFLKSIPLENMSNYGLSYSDDEHLSQLIKDMHIDTAKNVYQGEFWNDHKFSEIEYQNICDYYFDMAVNHGHAQATKLVQRSTWATQAGYRKQIVDDGVFGEKTLSVINGINIFPSLIAERAGFYRCLVAKDPSQEPNLEGWLNRAYR